jgi:hypothetical protein
MFSSGFLGKEGEYIPQLSLPCSDYTFKAKDHPHSVTYHSGVLIFILEIFFVTYLKQ